jgi:hypothetical protein
MDTNYDTMVALGTELEGHKIPNKSIRYALYREMAAKYFGRLGKGVRMKLTTCIAGEILDAYPKGRGGEYVGFKENNGEE